MAEQAIRDRLWRTFLSLPPAILRAASGGRSIHLDGRTLDPRFQFLLAVLRHGGDPISGESGVVGAISHGAMASGVREETVELGGARGTVTARMLTPSAAERGAPLIVYAARGAVGAGMIAKASASRVLVVPTPLDDSATGEGGRFPAGFDDLMAAYAWAREMTAREGTNPNPAIGGESVGGGLAAAACIELRRLRQPQPRLQLLIYPALDMTTALVPGPAQDAALIAPDLAVWLSGRYIGPADDPLDPRVSPLRVKDHAGLAPAVIVGAGFDPLADQATAYGRKLRAAGGAMIYRAFDALPHGFLAYAGLVETARAAADTIGDLAGVGLRGGLAGLAGGHGGDPRGGEPDAAPRRGTG